MIKCPNCWESHYRQWITGSTLMYYPPVIKNGVNINPDKNSQTTSCECIECGTKFSVQTNENREDYGKIF